MKMMRASALANAALIGWVALSIALATPGDSRAGEMETVSVQAPPAAAAPAATPAIAANPAVPASAPARAELAPQADIAQIEKLHAALLEAMKNAEELGYKGRARKVGEVVPETFDSRFMASKVVGRHWKKLDEAQQQQWTDTFQQLTIANLAGRFDRYSGESFETQGSEPAAHDTYLVRTVVRVPDGEDVQLNYRMLERDGEFRIVDVYFNGTVSEVALRRSDYASLLKTEGFDALLEAVDEQIEDLASGRFASK